MENEDSPSELPQFPPFDENKCMVVYPNDIVPFFIDVTRPEGKLCDIIQLPLAQADAKAIAQSLSEDMQLMNFYSHILSCVEVQVIDYRNLANIEIPLEPGKKPSAVHILQIEAGLNNVIYTDMLEWDIFDRTADPDKFARITVQELALPAEFVNVISGQIRWQCLRLRAMYSNPERLQDYFLKNSDAVPQNSRGLRSVPELIDASPAVGLVPGANAKREKASRDRSTRHWRRQGQTASSDALISESDLTSAAVKLVPIVRAAPLPEDNPMIDLTALPEKLSEEIENEELLTKVKKKFDQAAFMPQHGSDGSDEGSESD